MTRRDASGNGSGEKPVTWEATHEERRIVAADGTGIAYEVLGRGDKTLVLSNGLGGRLYAWTPAIRSRSTSRRASLTRSRASC